MTLLKNKRTRRKYDPSFKEDVIRMIVSGRPISEVSKALGVSASLVHRWYKATLSASNPSTNTDAQSSTLVNPLAEIERLRTELRRTEQERDILKKALGIFSRGT